MKRLLFKRHLCLKPKHFKRPIRYLKDPAIKNFLLQHLTPVKIDFSKVKNCFLNKLTKDENAIEKLFPELKEAKNETNSQSKNKLTNFKCSFNF